MLDAIIVGSTIRKLQKQKRMSQDLVSGLAGIGRSHFGAIERGEMRPKLETFYKIGQAMRIRPSVLLAAIEAEVEKET